MVLILNLKTKITFIRNICEKKLTLLKKSQISYLF